jgi:hypothetical protein
MAARENYPERKVPYKPRPATYKNKGKRLGPRPHVWISGPDPLRHEQYICWLKAKAQANFRKESWELTFEQYEFLWNQDGSWYQRGRGSDDLLMTRRDSSQPWNKDNCYIELRRTHLKRNCQLQSGKPKRKLGEGRLQNGKRI